MANTILTLLLLSVVVYLLIDNSALKSQISAIEEKFSAVEISEGEELDLLLINMNRMQIYSDKLWHAIDAENEELARFYAHEVEEVMEWLEEVNPVEDGYELGKMAKVKGLPEAEKLYHALDEKSGSYVNLYDALIQSCNACHTATGHAFLKVKRPERPVFTNQSYSK
ncbi:MAG: hypothetical protein LAT68_14690 [Cyclobacteriaceae bacterium]|nr:hypothetical protein [Cyclobacteriaceae bacterium]MCH8517568.1 hypothetical protein [Cyclobacteriaceae bacterium]